MSGLTPPPGSGDLAHANAHDSEQPQYSSIPDHDKPSFEEQTADSSADPAHDPDRQQQHQQHQQHQQTHDPDNDDNINLEQQLKESNVYSKTEESPEFDPQAVAQIEQSLEQLQHLPQRAEDHHPHQIETHHPLAVSDLSHQFSPQEQIGIPISDPAAAPETSEPQSQSHSKPKHGSPATKLVRLRKACDSCSIRKVKCDDDQVPCKACLALDIPCTYDRPSRRRGPPNRHAEQIKRRRLEGTFQTAPQEAPTSPTHAAEALAALSTQPSDSSVSAETICSFETIELLINDYFTHVHPLCPFPHEPSFREAWRRREDYQNPSFLALLASMLAALVASFPRKPRLYLKALRKDNLPPNHLALVDKCRKVCTIARGPGYLESDSLSVHDAATSYLLGMAAMHTFNWRQGKLYLGESLTILKALGMHLPKEDTFNDLGNLPTVLGSDGPSYEGSKDAMVDKITLQMGRRIYWTLFVTDKSMSQLGSNPSELSIMADATGQSQPPVPEEVDDFCIFPDNIDAQPLGQYPLVNASNSLINLYFITSLRPKLQPEAEAPQWTSDVDAYRNILVECKTRMVTESYSLDPEPLGRDPASLTGPAIELSGDERRALQQRIQSANLYAHALLIRLDTVDAVLAAIDTRQSRITQQDEMDSLLLADDALRQEMLDERDNLTSDVLCRLSQMDALNLLPGPDVLNAAVRLVAAGLIDAPREHLGPVTEKAEADIRDVLDALAQLERISVADGIDLLAVEDEDGRRLALVHECQAKFGLQAALREQE